MMNNFIEIHNRPGHFFFVDAEDFERVSCHRWNLRGPCRGSLGRVECGKYIPLANFIMRRSRIMYDHIDRDPLNNSKANLRECSCSQNSANKSKIAGTTSKFKGVSWKKSHNKWTAQIKVEGHKIYLGLFKYEHEAAKAYDAAAIKFFKEFANLNFK